MAEGLDSNGRINLRRTSVLVLDSNPQSLDVMRQILAGFGVRTIYACETLKDAKAQFNAHQVELIVVDPLSSGNEGYDFIRWTRREEDSANRCTPVIAAMGHQTLTNVRQARDAGANLVVAKPLSPEVLLKRITWVAKEARPFIVAPNYVGPDRRFKNEGPPAGMDGRRHDDLSLAVPEMAAPNMDQNEIDELFKPRRVSL
jgi:CheY-like chemotaxis protein